MTETNLCLRKSNDDEEEEENDGDDCSDVLDDLASLTSRLDDKLLRHFAQDGDRAEPLALAVRHFRRRVDDVTEGRIPSSVGAKVRIPPDALPDLDSEPLHVRVPEQFTAGDASQARLLVVQCDSEKFQCYKVNANEMQLNFLKIYW